MGIRSGSYASRFQYTGQAWLPKPGMAHLKGRTYSPTLGFRQPLVPDVGVPDDMDLDDAGIHINDILASASPFVALPVALVLGERRYRERG